MQQMKKLLLIMPRFFDYPDVISEELQNMGYEVDFYDDRPSTKGIVKAIIRVNQNLIHGYIRRYFDRMMEYVRRQKYDTVFLISGQSLSFSKEMLQELKACQKQAEFVLYQWDSMKNFPYIREMHGLFDRMLSFDRADCETVSDLQFLPLFYSRKYEEIGKKKTNSYQYDFSFVGTAHPKKYKFIRQMSEQLKSVYPKQFIYFFFPSVFAYYYRKLCASELKHARKSEFHFVPLKGAEMDSLITGTRCILDSPQAGQKGLTIRVLEALGAKKKLITTNEDVRQYDFYRPENIYIYQDKIDLEDVFFSVPYQEIEPEIYEKYALRNWLSYCLGGKK